MNLRHLFLATLAIGLLGCGGGGTGTTVSGSRLSLQGGAGFNGSASPITGGNANTTVVDGRIVATLGQGSRTVQVTFPATTLSAGQTYSVGGVNGATVVYSEIQNRDSVSLTWVGTGGTVTIRAVNDSGQAQIEISGATLTSDLTIVGNLADGTFTLNGNVEGVAISGSGNIGGDADLTFSSVTNVNGDTSSLNTGVVALVVVNGHSVLTTATGSASAGRVLTVSLASNAVAGNEITLSGLLNAKGFVSFASGTGSSAKVWLATGGKLRVIAKGANVASVELVDAKFTASEGGATGTFTLNGTIQTD